MSQTKESTPAPTLQSMDRGMRILELLAERPMRAKELADALGSKWATTHRTLTYLRGSGYVRRDEDSGLHYVGRRMFSIGAAYLNHHALLNNALPAMRALSDELGGFVQIAERDGTFSTAIASVEPSTPADSLTAYSMLGRRYPLHTGARSHVLLAHADREVIEEYLASPMEPLTAFSITDPDELRERLDETRKNGFAATAQDVTTWSVSAAAPVRDQHGEVVASAALINYHEDGERAAAAPRAIVELARSLSHALGWRLD
ncbi:IclR family transcriptional regulator [Streptomyces sp. NPDC005963]|uniref:IclR family transcriptional regulator n=1 Tax=Streptomyces sp. NPDC005963 TaxID=3156721 RepID=UPI0033CEE744